MEYYYNPREYYGYGMYAMPAVTPQSDVTDGSYGGVLEVQGIDFCIEANGHNHNTSKFDLMTRAENNCLVVRRGQPFNLDLQLNRPYDAKKDSVAFMFYVSDIGKRQPLYGTTAAVPLLCEDSEETGLWGAVIKGQENNYLTVALTSVADCIVGAWTLNIVTKANGTSSFANYTHPLPIYVLFNAWCSKDSVYMPEPNRRQEYVLEDGGIMFRGVYNCFQPSPWHYGQYQKDILDCAIYIVREVGKLKGRARGDPIRTVRALSAAINSSDDNGVVEGLWSTDPQDYREGKLPQKWVGSLAILQKYYEKKEPVKYGQCWVFAGVLTTICRALGIPCRPVTGFNAAHDSDGSLTIDYIIDDETQRSHTLRGDSVWNYHVWNEVWMERPDLGTKYGGWQVIDSTPQEESEYMYRCGPASLTAIKDGELQKPYDVGFVFAQVNADKIVWKHTGDMQPLQLISSDTTVIGRNISTKAIGKMDRKDITHTYKYPEGTSEERKMVETALRQSKDVLAENYLNNNFNDVTFEFELLDDIEIGQDFNVILHVENRSLSDSHQVKGYFRVDTVSYTGVTGNRVKLNEFDLNVEPATKKNVKMLVTFDDYYEKLLYQACFKIACRATIIDSQFEYFAQDDFRVKNPDIKISMDGNPVAHQDFNITVKLENPLPIPLTKCRFYIQATGLNQQLKVRLDEDIEPGAVATASFKLTPDWVGNHQISAKFHSNEIQGVDGFLTYTVARPFGMNGRPNNYYGNVRLFRF